MFLSTHGNHYILNLPTLLVALSSAHFIQSRDTSLKSFMISMSKYYFTVSNSVFKTHKKDKILYSEPKITYVHESVQDGAVRRRQEQNHKKHVYSTCKQNHIEQHISFTERMYMLYLC